MAVRAGTVATVSKDSYQPLCKRGNGDTAKTALRALKSDEQSLFALEQTVTRHRARVP